MDPLGFVDGRDQMKQQIKIEPLCPVVLRQDQRAATPPVTFEPWLSREQRHYTAASDVNHGLHVPGDMFLQWSWIVIKLYCSNELFSHYLHSKVTDEINSSCQTNMNSHGSVLYMSFSSPLMLLLCRRVDLWFPSPPPIKTTIWPSPVLNGQKA